MLRILHKKDMNEELAREILSWKYEPPYDFYNNDCTTETLEELLQDSYVSIQTNDGELFGFFCTGRSAQVPIGDYFGAYQENRLDIGLGMNPKYTGKGLGAHFFSFICSTIKEMYGDVPLRLTVASFNKRAIHLYKNAGFHEQQVFRSGKTEFRTMVLLAK